ncbi:hypothetical protein RO3G_13420 [Rhizopus delemar RA 99-880]|uniref:sphingomyelin phosphodiesterase n=1 Tax=Rhizopus delemar (strain RA 99-880 / ATCC MYA-4621 / FGSC 9543 / NRRL 43880) TaxID=246409 RepID=I1CJS9_RHIO9|nr:hypothetical protein RO3G_13420 [Rhizopus delemar RA 99-880]|eukprot:EIE88709.1 hypothetical protein RO3G_13420 [Rhizopus delemar RA 99-880]
MNKDSVTRGMNEEELNIPSESYHDNIEGNTQSDNEEEGNSTVRNGLPLENSCESSIINAQSAPPPYEFYPPAKTFLDRLPNWVRRISRLDTHQAIYLPTVSSQEEQTRSSRDRGISRWSYYYDVIKDHFSNWTLPPFIAHHRILVLCVSFSALILFSFLLFCSVFFSPAPLPEPTVPDKIAEHSLRFLTLNIFMRPPLIRNNWSDYKDDRLAYIEKYILPHYDLIVFQEAFAFASRRKDRLIRTARQMGFNHHVESPRKYPWNLGIDGGLLLLSRFPIRESHRIEYPRGQHADWFSVKGAVHALIELNSQRKMHLYTTHTQASYDLNNIINPGDTATRLSQFNLLRSFVQDTSNTDDHPILIAGDLNVDAATHKNKPITERSKESSPEYLEMVKTLHFDDLEDIVYKHYGYHPVTFGDYTTNDLGELVPAETVLTNWDQLMTVQSIDRIFWVSRNTTVLEPLSPQVEKFWVKENAEMTKEEKEQTGFTQISDRHTFTFVLIYAEYTINATPMGGFLNKKAASEKSQWVVF